MQHGVVPKEWAWLNYWTLLAQEGGKRNARHSAAGTKLSDTTSRHPQEMPSSSVMESVCIPQPLIKGEVQPGNYVGCEEMALGRGTDINRVSYLITSLISADLNGS